jgi:hypothetical protein
VAADALALIAPSAAVAHPRDGLAALGQATAG